MSKAPPVPRRQALRILGAATVAPAVAEGAWMFHPLVPVQEDGGPWRPRFFTADESATIEELAELIIPETDTPGARAANVHQYIDWIVSRAADGADGTNDVTLPRSCATGSPGSTGAAPHSTAAVSSTRRATNRTQCWNGWRPIPPSRKRPAWSSSARLGGSPSTATTARQIGMREELGYNGKQYLTGFEGCTHDEHLSREPESTNSPPAGGR